jgi:SagB-type dehydrogenase family enzyme
MNYRTQVTVSAAPEAVRILHFFEDWARPSDIVSFLPEYSRPSLLSALRQLREQTLLVAEGTKGAAEDEKLARTWASWLPEGSFHFATKNTVFLTPAESARMMKRYMEESQQPALVKSYPDARKVALPSIARAKAGLRRQSADESEFARVLRSRRTHREFRRGAVTLDQISKLLQYTWGVQGKIDAPPFGKLILKTSPSGGARHPGEVYVLALRVETLAPGLYHYDGLHHRLEKLKRLSATAARRKAVEYSSGHEFLKDASAVFLMTAVFPRTQWKYRFPRAYRVVLLDAGHLGQTFCLVATWLGLAPFCTAAVQESSIERDIGLDGVEESPLYLGAVGLPHFGEARRRRPASANRFRSVSGRDQ